MGLAALYLAGCGTVRAPAPAPAPAAGRSAGRDSAPDAPEELDALDTMLAADPDPRRNDIITVALSQVGLHYTWGGETPLYGFDCSGLAAYAYAQATGLALPRVTYDQARNGRPVTLAELRPADLVFYNTLRRPYSHVGIYLGRERFVHAPTTGKRVYIARMGDPYWRERYSGARRFLV